MKKDTKDKPKIKISQTPLHFFFKMKIEADKELYFIHTTESNSNKYLSVFSILGEKFIKTTNIFVETILYKKEEIENITSYLKANNVENFAFCKAEYYTKKPQGFILNPFSKRKFNSKR